jgi:hypothetical protein
MGKFKPRPKPESNFLSKSEKLLLAEEGVIFPLISVEYQEEGGYEGAARFLVGTELEGEEKQISFGVSKTGNESSRDRLLADVEEYLANDGEEEVLVAAELISTGKGNPLLSLFLVDEDGNRIEDEEDTEAEPDLPEEEEEEAKPVRKAAAKKAPAKAATATRRVVKK